MRGHSSGACEKEDGDVREVYMTSWLEGTVRGHSNGACEKEDGDVGEVLGVGVFGSLCFRNIIFFFRQQYIFYKGETPHQYHLCVKI